MTIPRNDDRRAATDRAIPKDTSSKAHHIAPDTGAAIHLRAWLIGLALDVQRTDTALLALMLAGWSR